MKSAKAMDDFLLDLIPLSRRGKQLGGGVTRMSANGISSVRYENVTITEMLQGERRSGVVVTFLNESYSDRSDQ
jgi:hypothetical protein